MKLAVVTACWQRPEIFEIFAKNITHLQQKFKSEIEIICIVAGSEGEVSEKMVKDKGFEYIEIPNTPLSRKINSTLAVAKELKSDYILCLGSDDLISDGLFEIYIEEMKNGTGVVVLGDFYFYDLPSDKAIYWGGYKGEREGQPVGAGMLLSSKFLDMWAWNIWTQDRDSSLDRLSFAKIKMTAIKKRFLSLKKNNVIAVDIKSTTNITTFGSLEENATQIPSSVIKEEFPYIYE